MPEIHKVYYSQKYLYLIKAGSEDLPSIPYEIKSTTPGLIMEEITAFLKKETNSHFLHSNDFEHWNISDRFLTLPLAVYDPQLKGTYWNQMFGTERKNYRLEESHSKSLKVQTVYEVPEWLNDFLRQQFNKTSRRVDGRIETHWLVNELGHRFIHVYFFCAKRPGIVFHRFPRL
jgi:hypothetical protein